MPFAFVAPGTLAVLAAAPAATAAGAAAAAAVPLDVEEGGTAAACVPDAATQLAGLGPEKLVPQHSPNPLRTG